MFWVVPASLIVKIPFIGNVIHIDNTFSCVLLAHVLVLAAFGWAQLWADLGQPGWQRYFGRFIAGLAVLLALYFGSTQGNVKSGFFAGYAAGLILAVTLFVWLAGRARAAGRSAFAPLLARRRADASGDMVSICTCPSTATW